MGLPSSFFDSLLLNTLHSFNRLAKVQSYRPTQKRVATGQTKSKKKSAVSKTRSDLDFMAAKSEEELDDLNRRHSLKLFDQANVKFSGLIVELLNFLKFFSRNFFLLFFHILDQ